MTQIPCPQHLADRSADALEALAARGAGMPAVAGFALTLGRMYHALQVAYTWPQALEVVRVRAVTPSGWPSAFRLYLASDPVARGALGELALERRFRDNQAASAARFVEVAKVEGDPRVTRLGAWAAFLGAFWDLSRAGGRAGAARPEETFREHQRALAVTFDADGFPVEFTVAGPLTVPPRRARSRVEVRRG